jgi:TatD DNase family protein
MLTDAHCHPYDLIKVFPGMETERRSLGVLCAASASCKEELEFNETLIHAIQADNAAGILSCFAVHPQLAAHLFSSDSIELNMNSAADTLNANFSLLEQLAEQGRLSAVGETGFDLFNAKYRETELAQDKIFAFHIEIALRFDLPIILHVRRALHKIFSFRKKLKQCRAVVFHSWPGTIYEANALLKLGINAFFSFGTSILLNHRKAMHSSAVLPADRLLTESDCPYQPLSNPARNFSSWEDLPIILNAMAALRLEAGLPVSDAEELEKIIESNFRTVFGIM